MRDHVVLFVNGCLHTVSGEAAMGTLADFLRQSVRLIGTKVVCGEGDCGACSVLVGRPSVAGDTLEYQAIDSCIAFIHQLDAAHVVTVEGFQASPSEPLSVVQDAMVQCHGSQCGFCTPGFITTLHGLCEKKNCSSDLDSGRLTEEELRLGCSGNLCRCTGYVQIVEAGRSIDLSKVRRLNAIYPPGPILQTFRHRCGEGVELKADGRLILLPQSLDEAVQLKQQYPQSRLVGGATDIGVWMHHGRASADVSIGITGLKELSAIVESEDAITVGAGVTWSQLIEGLSHEYPDVIAILERFGSPQIRNVGTIGGNLVNASPIGDSIPFLMAIDARLNIVGPTGQRSIQLEDFYQGYKKVDLRDDEILQSIEIPKLQPSQRLKCYKISKRRDMDISTMTAALVLTIVDQTIENARIALGGVGPVVMRPRRAEDALIDQPWTIETMRNAGRIASREISAISDVRGSSTYRELLVENLFVKCFHEAIPSQELMVG